MGIETTLVVKLAAGLRATRENNVSTLASVCDVIGVKSSMNGPLAIAAAVAANSMCAGKSTAAPRLARTIVRYLSRTYLKIARRSRSAINVG